jgi:hypothetical protein
VGTRFEPHSLDGEEVALTRPRFRVISSTKWEVNIIKKYRVASSAMIFKMVGIWSPDVFDRLAKTMVKENASRSEVYAFMAMSAPYGLDSG